MTNWSAYDDLAEAPASSDTYLIRDASAGVVKEIETSYASKKLDDRTVFIQATEPSAGESSTGDVWIDIS